MTFTKEQLRSIAPIDDSSVSAAGLMVCQLAASHLAALERAENAEAERDEAAALVVTSRGEAHMATLAKERYMAELEEAERAIRAAFLLLNAVARESETFDTLPAVRRAMERGK